MAAGRDDRRLARLGSSLRGFVDQGKYAGASALVWRAGECVGFVSAGWRDMARRAPMLRDTIVRLASMTKPITSAAALMLVEDGLLELSAPLSRWLPEAARLQVLRTPGSELDDVVELARPPTLFDLMTHSAGFAWGKGLDLPITRAMNEATGVTPFVPHDVDNLVRRVCALPLIQQPGRGWCYSNATDLLGVVLARASGRSLPDLLEARVLGPLGMRDTGFHVPSEKLDRLSVGYVRDGQGALAVHDDAQTGFWSRPPIFPAAGGGLVSTLDDYLAFARMLLNGGLAGCERILSQAAVRRMTSNLLRPDQLRPLDPRVDFLQGQGFGLGLSIALSGRPGGRAAGSFSWPGGYGTTWFADPGQELVAVVMTQLWQDSLTELGPACEEAIIKDLHP